MSELTPLSLDDYEAIADAVQETERGRWFLAEFARRNRTADTAQVLEALAGLERRLAGGPDARKAARLVDQALRATRLARANAGGDRDRGFDAVERDLGLALEALGVEPPHDDAERRASQGRPVQTAAASPEPVLALPPPEAVEVDWVDLAQFEDLLLADEEVEEKAAVVPDAVVKLDASVAETPVELVGDPGHPRFVASASNAPEAASMNGERLAAPPPAAVRPRLPPADTPGLLDRLTDVERSILFA